MTTNVLSNQEKCRGEAGFDKCLSCWMCATDISERFYIHLSGGQGPSLEKSDHSDH